jgi:hypothetical protein
MESEYQWLSSGNMMKKLCWTILLVVISSVIILLEKVLLTPRRIRLMLEKQGINGPKPSFLFGNISELRQIHLQSPASADSFNEEWICSLFPHFHTWKQHYGMSNLHFIFLVLFFRMLHNILV